MQQKNFDSELQTYFGDLKQKIKHEHVSYLKSHPQLRQILNDFLSSCLLQQPENVYGYASEFFAYFNYQKDTVKYKPLVISGCAGVGKKTLIGFLLEKYSDLFQLSISYTTRRPRQGQVHGRQYYFVTKEQFQKQIEKGVFVEYCEVHGNYYGTHKGKLNQIISKGKIGILSIDIQGGQKVNKSFEGCKYLFIQPPNMEILQQRLKSSGRDSSEPLEKRLNNAKEELQIAKDLEYYQNLTNDDLEKAKKDIVSHINKIYELSLQ